MQAYRGIPENKIAMVTKSDKVIYISFWVQVSLEIDFGLINQSAQTFTMTRKQKLDLEHGRRQAQQTQELQVSLI